MKKMRILMIVALSLALLAACSKEGEQPAEKIDINIAAMKGPTGMGMVGIMDKAKKEEAANNYNFSVVGAADEVSAGLLKGEFDIAAVPCNLASILYNKTEGDIQMIGINTLGVLYIVETGEEINSVEDLRGKTIYSTGFGTTPQYSLNYLLNSYGIDPEVDVEIEYKTEATEVAALLSEETGGIAMLPQPFVTTVLMNNEEARIALDIDEEWGKTGDKALVTGVVVVRKEFLEENKNAVESFMKEYEESAKFVNENVEDAGNLIEEFDIFKAPVAQKAIPFSNITFIKGQDMKEKAKGYLEVLHGENPESIGGNLPKDDFYYIP